MSLRHMTAVFAACIKPASAKFVLLAYADTAHDEDGLCWPSLALIAAKTDLDRKTIMSAMRTLIAAGALIETDERRGATQQVKVYRLPDKMPDIGTGPKTELSQDSPEQVRSSAEQVRFSAEQVRLRTTEPIEPKEPTEPESSAERSPAPPQAPLNLEPPPPHLNGKNVAYIPLIGWKLENPDPSKEYGVSPELLAELEAAYPDVDGPLTLKEIRAWSVANPTKRKTAAGMARFLNRWFSRVQNA